jgi:hypothetical protein
VAATLPEADRVVDELAGCKILQALKASARKTIGKERIDFIKASKLH